MSDDNVYRVQINLEKRGDELIFDDKETDLDEGVINLPYSGWCGAIVGQAFQKMEPSMLLILGRLLDCMTFNPEPGSLMDPQFGEVSVSPSGVYATSLGAVTANIVIARCSYPIWTKSYNSRRLGR